MYALLQLDEVPSVIDKLSSDSSIITVVFLAAGVALLKYLPAIIASFRGDGNGAEKLRADQTLSALLASTAATVGHTAKLDADLRENAEVRRHFHQVKNGMAAWQLLGLRLIEHLEAFHGKPMPEERRMLSDVAKAITKDPQAGDKSSARRGAQEGS